jgi:hypothetical protein
MAEVTTSTAFQDELRRALPRAGGVRGLLLLPALALLGTLIPGRLGTAFLDPIYHVFYTALAVLFGGSFAAQGFGGERERQFLINWTGGDAPVVLGKLLAATLWGWLCWLLIYGASLARIDTAGGAMALPVFTVFGAAVLAAGAAWLSAAAGALLALSTQSAMTARQLHRLGFFFILLLVVIVPRLFPADVQASLRALLSWNAAGHTMTIAGAGAALLGLHLYRRALRLLTEQRTGLSITS